MWCNINFRFSNSNVKILSLVIYSSIFHLNLWRSRGKIIVLNTFHFFKFYYTTNRSWNCLINWFYSQISDQFPKHFSHPLFHCFILKYILFVVKYPRASIRKLFFLLLSSYISVLIVRPFADHGKSASFITFSLHMLITFSLPSLLFNEVLFASVDIFYFHFNDSYDRFDSANFVVRTIDKFLYPLYQFVSRTRTVHAPELENTSISSYQFFFHPQMLIFPRVKLSSSRKFKDARNVQLFGNFPLYRY